MIKGNAKCEICGKLKKPGELINAEFIRPQVVESIRRVHPDFSTHSSICLEDLNYFREKYVRTLLESERGELTDLENSVLKSLQDREVVSTNINHEFDKDLTLGQRIADRVAEFGGSWRFIITFIAVMMIWISVNTIGLWQKPFDPYPYILLNLVLSCLAAVQAPIIMMSQNRQEEKDRLHAEHDYRVNLKAELEIRQLTEKIDLLISHQWQRLLEIQQIQIEMLEDMALNQRKESQK
ncbi:MAG TPA: DUF1003 domain-containing protein [Verrucomicrobiae bacterium]|nr:DUF1003 domain-containing protein [Verrucomicrobiae bacterium]